MADLPNQMTTMDFRQVLRSNHLRTMIVILIFFLINTSLGLLLDVTYYNQLYPQVPLETILSAVVTWQLTPIFTMLLLGVAAVSLFVTYAFYDRLMLLGTDYQEVTPDHATLEERQLYNVVEEMKIASGLSYMPRVFIINAEYMNAFASGYSEKSAMVAITRGLLRKLNRDELQAVMAHELSHIRHDDIRLTLTASLLANLAIMVIDILFYQMVFSNRRRSGNNGLFVAIYLLRFLLPIISLILLLYLSRTREFMADAGCVELMRTNEPLASALIKINQDYQTNQAAYQQQLAATPHENVRRSAYLFDPSQAGIQSFASINDMFSTHPSLEARLTALGYRK